MSLNAFRLTCHSAPWPMRVITTEMLRRAIPSNDESMSVGARALDTSCRKMAMRNVECRSVPLEAIGRSLGGTPDQISRRLISSINSTCPMASDMRCGTSNGADQENVRFVKSYKPKSIINNYGRDKNA